MAKYCCCEQFYNIDDFKEGARVKFRELPVSIAKELRLIIDEDFTIKSVLFKVNQLGEIMMVVELNQLPGRYFSPNILMAKRVDATPVEKVRENTLKQLIKENTELSSENSYLKNTLYHSLLGNFEN